MKLSDSIEKFIRDMMSETENELEIRRNELAEYFSCAPSQINYVLSTRFTPKHGYALKSTRGGGGSIRIYRLRIDEGEYERHILNELLSSEITDREANIFIDELSNRKIIDNPSCRLMKAAVSDKSLEGLDSEGEKNLVRGQILRQMLIEALK